MTWAEEVEAKITKLVDYYEDQIKRIMNYPFDWKGDMELVTKKLAYDQFVKELKDAIKEVEVEEPDESFMGYYE